MSDIEFRGYFPGLVGKIIELHGRYYAEHQNLDVTFETQVGRELSEFVANFQSDRDGLWAAMVDGAFAGAIGIDGHNAFENGARLRWFIVDPAFQGRGIGRALVQRTVDFCREQGYPKVFLWTFKGLDAAKRLYLQAGFTLVEEHDSPIWGRTLVEQKYDLALK